jgi:1,4-alpha-glucan branching enzyme
MTNYPENHDEVGNINDRITAVAGPGQGFRRNKVAAAATLLSRGVPMWFMGSEYGEWRQFQKDGSGPIELHFDEADYDRAHLLHWWNRLCDIHRGDTRVHGPAPIGVNYAQDRMLAFTRGENADLFVLLNFGDWSGWRSLAELNLPDGDYKELLNSTWGEYRVDCEDETERSNGGWAAHLNRGSNLNIPPYGAVVLERN